MITEETFEQIADVMEKALASVVADLQLQREVAAQRLEDIKRRIDISNRLHEEAKSIRVRAGAGTAE